MPVKTVIEAWNRMPSQIAKGHSRGTANPTNRLNSVTIVAQPMSFDSTMGGSSAETRM